MTLSFSYFWLLIILPVLPFFYFLSHFVNNMQKLDELEENVGRIHLKTVRMEEIQRKENQLLTAMRSSDPHYLDKQIETLTFLMPEIKKLETLHIENPDDEQLSKRLQQIKEGGNRLLFVEEQIRSQDLFRETEERQQHPVEMNEEDLKKLLCLVEGITIWPYGPKDGRPQLLIKEFILSKKVLPQREKVYVVSMQLIKRENTESFK